jgi:hypothetical protein
LVRRHPLGIHPAGRPPLSARVGAWPPADGVVLVGPRPSAPNTPTIRTGQGAPTADSERGLKRTR